jgi:hypothetical protein
MVVLRKISGMEIVGWELSAMFGKAISFLV